MFPSCSFFSTQPNRLQLWNVGTQCMWNVIMRCLTKTSTCDIYVFSTLFVSLSENNFSNFISQIFYRYRCPICSKSVFNMSNNWERLDEEVLCNISACSCMHIVLCVYTFSFSLLLRIPSFIMPWYERSRFWFLHFHIFHGIMLDSSSMPLYERTWLWFFHLHCFHEII